MKYSSNRPKTYGQLLDIGHNLAEHVQGLTELYYTRIEVKAQMPVEQPVLDTNYKHLKIIRTWPKTTVIKTIITIAFIVAYRGKSNIKCLRTPQKTTTTTTTKNNNNNNNNNNKNKKQKTGCKGEKEVK